MPQVVLIAAAGAVAYAAYRMIRREIGRAAVRLAEQRVPVEIDRPQRLVRDADGVYRPER